MRPFLWKWCWFVCLLLVEIEKFHTKVVINWLDVNTLKCIDWNKKANVLYANSLEPLAKSLVPVTFWVSHYTICTGFVFPSCFVKFLNEYTYHLYNYSWSQKGNPDIFYPKRSSENTLAIHIFGNIIIRAILMLFAWKIPTNIF